MAQPEKPKRERARLMYLRSRCTKTATAIGKTLSVSPATVRSWKRRDKWDDDERAKKKPAGGPPADRKGGGQPGNQNALGASRDGNTNAESTGEHSRITPDSLTDDERALIASLPSDHREALRRELELLTVRERRMMQRIAAIQGREDPEGLILDGTSSTQHRTSAGGKTIVSGSDTTNRSPAIDRIIRMEEALTRVQAQKARILLSLHESEAQRGSASREGLVIVYDYGDEQQGAGYDENGSDGT